MNKKNKTRRLGYRIRYLTQAVFLFLFLPALLYAEESVRIKILAVNPSDTKRLEASVTHYLPPEIKPEDILDAAGMAIKYDGDKQSYYVTGKVELDPKETKTIGIRVKNVWVISDDAIAKIKEELAQNLKSLKETDYGETAKLITEKVTEKLATIEEERSKASGMRQRVELYRAHVKELESIEKDMLSMDSLRKLKSYGSAGIRTAKFVVIAENPLNEDKEMTVRALLPKEIEAGDVLDRLGFLVLFDAEVGRYAVEKQDKLAPNEKKKYELTLRDVWYIPDEKLELMKKQIGTLTGHFKGSNYEAFAMQQISLVTESIEEIKTLQDEVANSTVLDDRIRAFVLNTSKYELASQKIKDLEDLLLEVPMKRQENVIEQLRKAVRSLSHIIDIIKLGFKPDLSTTWWIILGLIAFLFIMAASFYVIWVSKLKDAKVIKKADKGKKEAPAKAAPTAPAAQGAGTK